MKVYNVPTQADYYLGRALAIEGHYDEAAREFHRATALADEMQRRSYYELAQTYRHFGENYRSTCRDRDVSETEAGG